MKSYGVYFKRILLLGLVTYGLIVLTLVGVALIKGLVHTIKSDYRTELLEEMGFDISNCYVIECVRYKEDYGISFVYHLMSLDGKPLMPEAYSDFRENTFQYEYDSTVNALRRNLKTAHNAGFDGKIYWTTIQLTDKEMKAQFLRDDNVDHLYLYLFRVQ